MRPAAQIGEIVLLVQADGLLAGDALDDLRLVVLALVLEELDRLRAVPDPALDLDVALGDLGHALLDGRKILGRERPLVGKIVVEAVFDHRPDGDLRVGEQLLHRMRKQVRRRVAKHAQPLGIPLGDDGHIGIGVDAVAGIDQLAVDLAAQRGARQPGADARSHLGHTDRLRKGFDGTVGESDIRHGCARSCQKKSAVEPHFFAHAGRVQRSGSSVLLVLSSENPCVLEPCSVDSLVGAIGLEPTTPTMSR